MAANDNVGANSGSDYLAEKALFEAGQMADSLAFPTHLVEGPLVQSSTTSQRGSSSNRGTAILLFADGSTRHLDLFSGFANTNTDEGLINARNAAGMVTSPQSGYLTSTGTPLPDELVFNQIALPWSTKDFSPAAVPRTGAPGDADGNILTPAQHATAFFKANDYVNVTESDPTARASEIKGMFVGADQDGPLGLIGTWELTGRAFGVGVERAPIRGAFGADIQP